MSPIRILLADDHTLLVQALRDALNQLEGLKVVATAANGQEAIDWLSHHPCDLAILDVRMPVLDGISTAKLIRQHYPRIRILMLTVEASDTVIKKFLEIGVGGFVLKDIDLEEFSLAIRQVMNGRQYVSGKAETEKLELTPSEAPVTNQNKSSLTRRELEITRLIVQGFTNNEIADKLSISLQTVQTHRKNLIRKTGSKNVIGLINYAVQNGLIEGAILPLGCR